MDIGRRNALMQPGISVTVIHTLPRIVSRAPSAPEFPFTSSPFSTPPLAVAAPPSPHHCSVVDLARLTLGWQRLSPFLRLSFLGSLFLCLRFVSSATAPLALRHLCKVALSRSISTSASHPLCLSRSLAVLFFSSRNPFAKPPLRCRWNATERATRDEKKISPSDTRNRALISWWEQRPSGFRILNLQREM